MSPKITCSILCYNYGRFLARAIDSCLEQNVDPALFEILVIDDGSTDNTPEVCASYGDRIRVSRTANQGFGTSLARGLQEARGEYVAYLDADDWWLPEKLAVLVPHLQAGVLAVIHPLLEVDEAGEPLGRTGADGNTSSVCVHREAGLTLLPATSEIFCRPFLDLGKGVALGQPLGCYRIHGKAMTDRSPNTGHTAFFSKTSHTTADRLFALAEEPPFWIKKPKALEKLARRYRSEGCIKDFERATELNDGADCFRRWVTMAKSMVLAGRWPQTREWRLTGRMVRKFWLKMGS